LKKIPLSNNKVAIVDDSDYELVNQYKWHYNQNGYAVRNQRVGVNKYTAVYMHRFICGLVPGDGKIVDHKNGNGLDNRRENLRVCTKTQNQQNQKPRHTRVSKYKGVGFYKRDQKWRARIVVDKTDIELGKFDTEIEAAKAYNEVAKKYHGEFAWINKIKMDDVG